MTENQSKLIEVLAKVLRLVLKRQPGIWHLQLRQAKSDIIAAIDAVLEEADI